MDALLHIVDSCASTEDDTTLHCDRDVPSARYHQTILDLPAHGEAFDWGLITCSRLLEVLVHPFLKLARKVNQEQQAQEDSAGDSQTIPVRFLRLWTALLHNLLAGKLAQEGKIQPLLRPKKRQELIKALLADKFPEVRIPRINLRYLHLGRV